MQRSEQHRGTTVVAAHVVLDVGEVDAEADLGRLVADRIDAVEYARNGEGRSIADIGPVIGGGVVEPVGDSVVCRGVEIVDDDDVVAQLRRVRRR